MDPIDRWHELLRTRDPAALHALLDADAVFAAAEVATAEASVAVAVVVSVPTCTLLTSTHSNT